MNRWAVYENHPEPGAENRVGLESERHTRRYFAGEFVGDMELRQPQGI